MMAAYLFYGIVIITAIGFAAFFSGTETAYTSIKFMKMLHLIEIKDRRALLVHRLLKRPDRLLATTLIGTNIAVVIASAFSTRIVFSFYPQAASLIATALITPLVLIFGEIIPKTICRNRANAISLTVSPWLLLSEKIFSPILVIVSGITTSMLNLVAPRTIKKNPFLTKDEIKLVIRDVSKEGIIEDYEREVIDRILDFTLTKAADIMVPLKEVVSVDIGETQKDIIQKAIHFGFTRFPVLEDKQIRGIINIFDIFYNDPSSDWHEFIRPVRSVAFGERLDVVFSVMQPNKEAMVVVLQDNMPIGILTIEDLMEEIVYRARPQAIEGAEQPHP